VKNEKLNKNLVVTAVTKMIAKKEAVRSYMRGEMPKNTLTKKVLSLPNHYSYVFDPITNQCFYYKK